MVFCSLLLDIAQHLRLILRIYPASSYTLHIHSTVPASFSCYPHTSLPCTSPLSSKPPSHPSQPPVSVNPSPHPSSVLVNTTVPTPLHSNPTTGQPNNPASKNSSTCTNPKIHLHLHNSLHPPTRGTLLSSTGIGRTDGKDYVPQTASCSPHPHPHPHALPSRALNGGHAGLFCYSFVRSTDPSIPCFSTVGVEPQRPEGNPSGKSSAEYHRCDERREI